VHITAASARTPRPGIRFHRAQLPSDELTLVDGIPTTSVPRTLLDLSATNATRLRRLVKEAEFLGLVDHASLTAILDRYPRRPGRRPLATLVEAGALGQGRTRSEMEDRFLAFCRRHRLPLPETNVVLEVRGRRIEADCVWRRERVAVELDSRSAHGGWMAFEDDRARDRALAADGWVTMRVTWPQLHTEPAALAAELRAALAVRASDRK
jgi:very-short-patch-repair endonuclease